MRAGVKRRPGLTTNRSESGPHAKRVAETRAWLRHTSVRLADAHADHRTLVERFRDEIRDEDRMEGMDSFAAAALRVIWSVMALPPEELTPAPKWYSCGVFLGLLEVVVPVPNGLDSVKAGLEFCYCRLVGLLASDDWRAALERYTRSRMPDGWEDYEREQRAADEVSETITNIIEGSLIPPWPLHDARAFLFGVLGRRAMHIARDNARHIGWDAVSHLSMEDRNALDEYERVWRIQHVRRVLAQ